MTEQRRQRTRSRCFGFTLWQYEEIPVERFSRIQGVEYIIYQEEKSSYSRQNHLQGIIRYRMQKDFDVAKREIGGNAHIEIVKHKKNMILYCQKIEGRVRGPFTIGTVPEYIGENFYLQKESTDPKLKKRHIYNNFHNFRKKFNH